MPSSLMVQRARQHLPHAGASEYATLHRHTLQRIFDDVLHVQDQHPDCQSVVLRPARVESRWYQYSLHNHRAQRHQLFVGSRDRRADIPFHHLRPTTPFILDLIVTAL